MNRSVSTFRSSLIERTIQFEQLEDRRLLAAIQMTAQEQLLVELINRARANPEAEAARFGIPLNEDLEPGEISSDPKQPLAPNPGFSFFIVNQ